MSTELGSDYAPNAFGKGKRHKLFSHSFGHLKTLWIVVEMCKNVRVCPRRYLFSHSFGHLKTEAERSNFSAL